MRGKGSTGALLRQHRHADRYRGVFRGTRGDTREGSQPESARATEKEKGISEAAGTNPAEMRRRLIERSAQDEELRRRLLDDPKGTIEQEIGALLPEKIEGRVVEEMPDTIYLVLPPSSALATTQTSGELSDRELETVAGGWNSGPSGGSTSDMYLCEADVFSCPPYKGGGLA